MSWTPQVMLISTILGTGWDMMGNGWRTSKWFSRACFDSSSDLARGYVEILDDFGLLKILMFCQDMPLNAWMSCHQKEMKRSKKWRTKWKKWNICDEMWWDCSVFSSLPGSVTLPAKLQGRRFTRFFSPDSLRHPDPTWCDRVDRANGSTVNVSLIFRNVSSVGLLSLLTFC